MKLTDQQRPKKRRKPQNSAKLEKVRKKQKNGSVKPVWAKLKTTVHRVYTQVAGKAVGVKIKYSPLKTGIVLTCKGKDCTQIL